MELIRVRAFPGAKKQHVEEVEPFVLRVFVRESAERNMANRAVIAAVAGYYGIPANRLSIRTGHRSMSKTLLILGS